MIKVKKHFTLGFITLLLTHAVHASQVEQPTNLNIPTELQYLENSSKLGIDEFLLEALSSDENISKVRLTSAPERSGAYNPEKNTIGLSILLPEFLQHDEAYVAQQLSTLAHELSHARDHLVLNQYDKSLASRLGTNTEMSDVKKLYRTELKAWVVEAMQCKLSGGMTRRMDLLTDSAKDGIDGVINSKENMFHIRIIQYKNQAGLPRSWGVEKILEKTKLKTNLDNALQLFEKTEIQSTDDAQHFLKELDMIFND